MRCLTDRGTTVVTHDLVFVLVSVLVLASPLWFLKETIVVAHVITPPARVPTVTEVHRSPYA